MEGSPYKVTWRASFALLRRYPNQSRMGPFSVSQCWIYLGTCLNRNNSFPLFDAGGGSPGLLGA